MRTLAAEAIPAIRSTDLSSRYLSIRNRSTALCATLAPEDQVVQSMSDVSPTKWHLAHVTWFLEHFILVPHVSDYRVFDESFDFLFNSYYYTVGSMYARPKRGLISRPTVNGVLAYRAHVDEAITRLLERDHPHKVEFLVELGLNHEQQHQELMLTDIKHVFFQNPNFPALMEQSIDSDGQVPELTYVKRDEAIAHIGHTGEGFAFDNETPRHRVLVPGHEMANRPITNGEYLGFIKDQGYETPDLWLSDGWATINERGWRRPLYWLENLEQEFTLNGLKALDRHAPVTHISYYEADAFARWAGKRLPTEAEWETLAHNRNIQGNFVESGYLHPCASSSSDDIHQLLGDVWEWTMSTYAPYPGFKPLAGSLGEYNGKFMCSQLILRGGSCATPQSHVRASYRNFFYPDARWQFSGIRLAGDV